MKKFFIFFNLFSKIFIMSNLLLFSIMSIFLNDFFIMWFFMEINNFMFTSLMCLKLPNKKIIFFYYIIQTMASLLMIFSIMYSSLFFQQFNFYELIFIISLIIKLGIPPFHLWMISISMFLSWDLLFLFLSIQKIIPLYMLSLMEMNLFILYIIIIFSSYVSTFKMLMNLNFKIIMSYSSINQMSWMLLLIYFKNILWLMYFTLYSIIMLMVNMTFQFLKLSYNFFYNISSMNIQLIYMFLFFNLASLPPLSFFFMKWFMVFTLIYNSLNMIILIIIMLINSFILIYIYTNMMLLLMFFYSTKSKLLYMQYQPLMKFHFILFFSLFLLSLTMIMI